MIKPQRLLKNCWRNSTKKLTSTSMSSKISLSKSLLFINDVGTVVLICEDFSPWLDLLLTGSKTERNLNLQSKSWTHLGWILNPKKEINSLLLRNDFLLFLELHFKLLCKLLINLYLFSEYFIFWANFRVCQNFRQILNKKPFIIRNRRLFLRKDHCFLMVDFRKNIQIWWNFLKIYFFFPSKVYFNWLPVKI